jgi:hypothetical protein
MSNIQSLLAELDQLLRREIEVYECFIDLQHQEKQLAVARSLAAFQHNLQAKAGQATTIATLEARRRTLLDKVAVALHLEASEVTLQGLATRVGSPYAEIFSAQRVRLQTLLATLQRVNRENELFLQDSLAFIHGALAFFATLMPDHLTYEQSGAFATPVQGRLISGRV